MSQQVMSGLTLSNVTLAAPPLQLLLQIFTHLQALKTEREARVQHIEDRYRKEHARRVLLELQLTEETSALRLRAQGALEAAAETQHLLHLARTNISSLVCEVNRSKEMVANTRNLLISADEKIQKYKVITLEKDTLLQQVFDQNNITRKELEDIVEERDRLQKLLELKDEFLEKAKESATLTEGRLQVASLEIGYYRNISEDRSKRLDEARHKAAVAEGHLHVAMMENTHYRKLFEDKNELLEQMKQQNSDLSAKLKIATEEINYLRIQAEENKRQFEQSGRRYNASETFLQKLRGEMKELEKISEERRNLLEVSDAKVNSIRKELEDAKQQLRYFKNLAQSREAVIGQVEEKANITEGFLNVAKQQTQRFVNLAMNASQDLIECKMRLDDVTEQVRDYLLPLVPSMSEGLTVDEALISAARTGNVTEMFILLTSGADIESCDSSYQETPLTWAAEKGHYESCRFLVERNADVNARATGWKNRTALHAAAINGHLAVVQLLVDNGAHIRATNSDGNTAADEANALVKVWLLSIGG